MPEKGPIRNAAVFWISGLSGAGKSTVAEAAQDRLTAQGYSVLNLDGDAVRDRLHTSLGFTREDVLQNNLGIARLCAELVSQYDAIMAPVISPLKQGREGARTELGESFYLVYCDADIDLVRRRDVKGLYARADRGEISDMIGYSQNGLPFEPPADADLILHTGRDTSEDCVDRLCAFIQERIAAPGRS